MYNWGAPTTTLPNCAMPPQLHAVTAFSPKSGPELKDAVDKCLQVILASRHTTRPIFEWHSQTVPYFDAMNKMPNLVFTFHICFSKLKAVTALVCAHSNVCLFRNEHFECYVIRA